QSFEARVSVRRRGVVVGRVLPHAVHQGLEESNRLENGAQRKRPNCSVDALKAFVDQRGFALGTELGAVAGGPQVLHRKVVAYTDPRNAHGQGCEATSADRYLIIRHHSFPLLPTRSSTLTQPREG